MTSGISCTYRGMQTNRWHIQVPHHAVDTAALREYGADEPRVDVGGGSCHSHRLVLLRRGTAAAARLDLTLHLI